MSDGCNPSRKDRNSSVRCDNVEGSGHYTPAGEVLRRRLARYELSGVAGLAEALLPRNAI